MFNESSLLGTATVDAPCSLNAEAVNLVYGLQLRLYELGPELDTAFRSGTSPRKLDVQKIRVAVKSLYKDLCVAYRMLEGEPWRRRLDQLSTNHRPLQSHSAVASRAQRCIEIDHGFDVSAAFLLESGDYLDSKSNWPSTREFRTLNSTIQDAVNGIWISAAGSSDIIISETPRSMSTQISSFKTLDGLLLMWPLYAAQRAPGISEPRRLLFEEALYTVGEVGRIPKAVTLVGHHAYLNGLVD
ncbi:MAG: hypothetical protein Q9214_001454 [Letrouitia sp. 1 TL-2023]